MAKFFKANVSTVIFKEDKVLIQKRAQDEEVFPGLWGIPGGTIEFGDKDLESGLEREVAEEVGVKISNHKLIRNNIKEKEVYGVIYMVFSSDYVSGDAKALDGTEKVAWMTLDEIEKLEFTPTIKETIQLAYARNNIAGSTGR